MRLFSLRFVPLTVLSALLQIGMFPVAGPLPGWAGWLAWVALVPWFYLLLRPASQGGPTTARQAAAWGYGCGILWYLGNCSWTYETMHLYGGLPHLVAAVILLLLALYLGLYHAFFAFLIYFVGRRLGARAGLLAAPFLWVAVELARARVTGFPWDLLGYTQIENSLLTQLAPLAGVMALSFVVAAVNAGLAAGWLLGRRGRLYAVAALAVAAGLSLLGTRTPPPFAAPARAVLLQENLSVGATSRDQQPLTVTEELQVFARASLAPFDHVPAGGGWTRVRSAPPALVVWPEAPSHLLSNDPTFQMGAAALAEASGAPAILGSLGMDAAPDVARGYRLYDSAVLIAANGKATGRYDKIHLVPWGEYVPFKPLFRFAEKLTEGVGDMDPGTTRTVFRTGGHTYGVFICYESIFGDEVRHFALNGAEVLVNISDDGWYGDSGAPWQHLAMARMRAIENRRWLLRATNTGVTTAIDPAGRMLFQAPRHVRAAFVFPFGYAGGTTFYTRHGDWFAWLCLLVSAAFVLFGFRLNSKHVERS